MFWSARVRRFSFSHPMRFIPKPNRGAALIAVGMSMLLLAVFLPALPAITAMSLVALGTTEVTLTRFRDTPALVPVMLVHAATYGGLYAVFIGAALHAASMSSSA